MNAKELIESVKLIGEDELDYDILFKTKEGELIKLDVPTCYRDNKQIIFSSE